MYSLESYARMSEIGSIHFSALKYALNLDEFRDILLRDLGISPAIVKNATTGCRNCWSDLENALNKKKNKEMVVKLNNILRVLDFEYKLKKNPALLLNKGTLGKFKNMKDAEIYLKGIRVFKEITITFK